eukprot:6181437-Pleurochrysis_carterae.AAC.4
MANTHAASRHKYTNNKVRGACQAIPKRPTHLLEDCVVTSTRMTHVVELSPLPHEPLGMLALLLLFGADCSRIVPFLEQSCQFRP